MARNEGTSITERRLMAANRYAEMVRWMAWPRIKNSRSSAQPGTHPHDGVQATVTPAPDAEPPPGSRQNTGIGGTTHAVAYRAAPHSRRRPAGRPKAAPDQVRARRQHRACGPHGACGAGQPRRTGAIRRPPPFPTARRRPARGTQNSRRPAGALPPTAAPASGIAPPASSRRSSSPTGDSASRGRRLQRDGRR